MVLAVIFRAENTTFAKQLRTAIRNNKTIHIILKKISQGDIKKFIKKDKFLLFQGRIYMPIKLRSKIITE